jgi:predicted branched-subunit amino acid permease
MKKIQPETDTFSRGSGPNRKVLRDGLSIGVATGTYGLSFGVLATSAHLSLAQTCALSLLMFTGASQLAFAGVVAAGGAPLAGAASAALLGSRIAFYGFHLSRLLRSGRLRRLVTAHFVIDESAAMSLGQGSRALDRLGFWTAGLSVFFFWNLATLAGALGAHFISDPKVYGLDAVAPAAFVALIARRLRDAEAWRAAIIGAIAAVAFVPVVPAGVPVLLAALIVVVVALAWPQRTTAAATSAQGTVADHGAGRR